jgi:hypothetical protein
VRYVDLVPVLATALGAVVLAGAASVAARSGGPAARRRAVLASLRAGAIAVTVVVTLGPVTAGDSAGSSVNLVPFRDIGAVLRSGNASLAVVNLAGNILLFAPVGFLLGLLVRRPVLAVPLGIVLSTAEEALQFVVGRVADVDDVLLNALGTLLGVMAARAVRALWTEGRRHLDGRG